MQELKKIEQLIEKKKINQAQAELAKLDEKYFKDSEYLYLRSKIFYINELYYIAIDTLLIASEFKEKEKIYNLIAEIYNLLGNKELSKKILNLESRFEAINSLKNELSGIYRNNEKK
jgi:hypothetical protein